MIFDVVASARRDYLRYVLPSANDFRQRWPALTMSALATGGHSGLGLGADRWQTIRSVAAALDRYRATTPVLASVADEVLVVRWATDAEPIRMVPELDPYLGTVKGIGPALFAYLRMRSGADAIKPDRRVRTEVAELGFPTPAGERALLRIAEAAAEELGVSRLHLDQLLW